MSTLEGIDLLGDGIICAEVVNVELCQRLCRGQKHCTDFPSIIQGLLIMDSCYQGVDEKDCVHIFPVGSYYGDIGLRLEGLSRFPDLGIATTLANFQSVGNIPVFKDRLNNLVIATLGNTCTCCF